MSEGTARKDQQPTRDFCPLDPKGHTFSDYTYWGSKHPMCSCGYEDKTRTLEASRE